jgi:hypothetical protein
MCKRKENRQTDRNRARERTEEKETALFKVFV